MRPPFYVANHANVEAVFTPHSEDFGDVRLAATVDQIAELPEPAQRGGVKTTATIASRHRTRKLATLQGNRH